MAYLLAAKTFLAKVPWQIWAAIGLALAGYIYGEARFNAGKQVVLERLEAAQEEAEAKAGLAREAADAGAAVRAEQFEQQQDTLEKVIDDVEAAGGNSLDALLGSLSEAD